MRRLGQALVFLATLSFAVVVAPSFSVAAQRALLISVQDYNELPDLTRPIATVDAYEEALSRFGLEVSVVENPFSDNELERGIDDFVSTIESGDDVLIVYVGHGFSSNDVNYMAPSNVSTNDVDAMRRSSVAITKVIGDVTAKKPNSFVFVFDACRSPGQEVAFIDGVDYSPTTREDNRVRMIFSTASRQFAFESFGADDADDRTVFARYFIPELKRGRRLTTIAEDAGRVVFAESRKRTLNQEPQIRASTSISPFYLGGSSGGDGAAAAADDGVFTCRRPEEAIDQALAVRDQDAKGRDALECIGRFALLELGVKRLARSGNAEAPVQIDELLNDRSGFASGDAIATIRVLQRRDGEPLKRRSLNPENIDQLRMFLGEFAFPKSGSTEFVFSVRRDGEGSAYVKWSSQ